MRLNYYYMSEHTDNENILSQGIIAGSDGNIHVFRSPQNNDYLVPVANTIAHSQWGYSRYCLFRILTTGFNRFKLQLDASLEVLSPILFVLKEEFIKPEFIMPVGIFDSNISRLSLSQQVEIIRCFSRFI